MAWLAHAEGQLGTTATKFTMPNPTPSQCCRLQFPGSPQRKVNRDLNEAEMRVVVVLSQDEIGRNWTLKSLLAIKRPTALLASLGS